MWGRYFLSKENGKCKSYAVAVYLMCAGASKDDLLEWNGLGIIVTMERVSGERWADCDFGFYSDCSTGI